MQLPCSKIAALTLAAAALITVADVHADAGHDHGPAAAATPAQGLPRFAATSELFELVGVVDGTQLTLYLDRSDDNSPVKGAKLEIELGGNKVEVKAGAEGEFAATLAQPLQPGVTPVTATVVAGDETDLLAGEISMPEPPQAEAAAPVWRRYGGWAAAGLLLAGALAWFVRRFAGRRAARLGAAA